MLANIFDQSTAAQQEFLAVFARAVGRLPRSPMKPDNPDAHAISLCRRLTDIERALSLAHELIPDEDTRDIALEPLNRAWWKAVGAIFKVPPPRTREGVNAAAKFMLSYAALEDYAEAANSGDVLMWGSRVCAEYLAAEAAP